MNRHSENNANKAVDEIQQYLTDYACALNYESLSPEAIHAAKVRVIDTLGALMGGFFTEPCSVARNVAAQMPDAKGATVIGTRLKTTPDMAAFVNASTARYSEGNDFYHWPGAYGGHGSDVLTPALAAAEYMRNSGREFITGVVLGYEVFLRICDVFHNKGFDHTNFSCVGTAVAAGKLFGLSPMQLSHCISMAVVPNNILKQVRTGHLSAWKAVASGQAGRSGVFAAMLARGGMEGPHLPFEGKAGWCEHVAKERISLNSMGGNGTPFKILDTLIKTRLSAGNTISSILAAEKIAPLRNVNDVHRVTVEVYKRGKDMVGTGEHNWHPESPETADHSIPYVVAATLMDGTITPQSFTERRVSSPDLHALMQKIEVLENAEFTAAHARHPQEHHTRVTVVTGNGERLIGSTGGDSDDLTRPKSDAQVIDKFRGLTEELLGTKCVSTILDCLWHLEDMKDVSSIPPLFNLV